MDKSPGPNSAAPILTVGVLARLLLVGQKNTHIAEGRVVDLTVETIFLEIAGRPAIALPAASVASVEVASETTAGQAAIWRPAALPPPMSMLMGALSGALLTGAGALIKEAQPEHLTRVEERLVGIRQALVSVDAVGLVDALLEALGHYRRMFAANSYDEALHAHKDTQATLRRLFQSCDSLEVSERLQASLVEVGSRLRDLANKHWAKYQASVEPRPRFITAAKPVKVSVDHNGEAILPFRLHLEDSFAPAKDLRVEIDEVQGMSLLGAPPQLPALEPGQERTVNATVTLSTDLVNRGNLRVRGQITYSSQARQRQNAPKQVVEFELKLPEVFQLIENPYTAYAGGTTVSDPEMFFGREQLIDELSKQLSSGPLGQCYALYGQKRTGKSSVLEQVRRRLEKSPVIVAALSFGTIDFDRAGITAALVREVLEQVRVPLLTGLPRHESRALNELWPDDRKIDERPLESLRTALLAGRRLLSRERGWAGLRYVLLVDEFTYLFEVLRRADPDPHQIAGIRDFMRQWKALLESQTFSALVLGQDTMPYFMQRFPNEFSSLTTRRLSYLDYDETASLADLPVRRRDGSSRYTGHALSVLHSCTDGHPFFTQIVCERLVRRANRKQSSDFGEQDVLETIESLLEGEQAIDFHRFDCFLTADNTGLIASVAGSEPSAKEDTYDTAGESAMALLQRTASLGGHQNRAVASETVARSKSEREVLEDLILREVVVDAGGSVKVRVALFADYLRRHW